MTQDICRASWKKARWTWKEQVNSTQGISRGAKLLGLLLCDRYANHQTARCWPSNATLADLLGVNKRTVQRYLIELRREGWVRAASMKGKRRAMELCFPPSMLDGDKGDTGCADRVTLLSPQHDRSVAPHIEPMKNLRSTCLSRGRASSLRYLIVGHSEANSLESWKAWVADNTCHDPAEVLNLLQRRAGFLLPSRYPDTQPENIKLYQQFFDLAANSEGRFLGM